MNNEALKQLVAEWLERPLPNVIERDQPTVDLEQLGDILAVTGPRRAGKTFYLYQLIGNLFQSGWNKEDILFIDFEDYRLMQISPTDVHILFRVFRQLTGKDPSFVFFDEVQHLADWSRVLRTLHNTQQYHIVVSGSSSELSIAEISSELRGRYRERRILPFSFQELLRYRKISYDEKSLYTSARGDIISAFDQYLQWGGFPEVVRSEKVLEKRELLQAYIKTIYYRDLIERCNIRAKSVLDMLMKYCLDTFAELFSISGFTNHLKNNETIVSKRTVANYLLYLRESYFLLLSEKFSYSPRKRIMNPKKIYLLDSGFGTLNTMFSENRGMLLENLVATELFRRGEDMYYFKNNRECDFVLGTRADAAIQVCWELNPSNQTRELKGLAEAMSRLQIKQGFILTYNQEDQLQLSGMVIPVQPAWRWLLTS